MVTIKQAFQMFGTQPEWRRFAVASVKSMAPVILRKYGATDINEVNDFTLSLWCELSDQPDERKVQARSCMKHLIEWARQKGIYVAEFEVSDKSQAEPQKPVTIRKAEPKKVAPKKPVAIKKVEPKKVAPKKPVAIKKVEPKKVAPQKPVAVKETETNALPIYPKRYTGTIYFDEGAKDIRPNGKRTFKSCWRAEITIDGQRYRHRSQDRLDCEEWLKAVRNGDIKPTDNKADWWRMEQRKDESARIDEIIVSAAEEATLLYDYHQTKNLEPIFAYLTQRLIPHMAYYCAHTLSLGKRSMLTASRQAVALLLTRIIVGRPVINFTATCKRMLRLYKQRGDFFYYENSPAEVQLMVNKIDLSMLAEVWKVTKDRRI